MDLYEYLIQKYFEESAFTVVVTFVGMLLSRVSLNRLQTGQDVFREMCVQVAEQRVRVRTLRLLFLLQQATHFSEYVKHAMPL